MSRLLEVILGIIITPIGLFLMWFAAIGGEGLIRMEGPDTGKWIVLLVIVCASLLLLSGLLLLIKLKSVKSNLIAGLLLSLIASSIIFAHLPALLNLSDDKVVTIEAFGGIIVLRAIICFLRAYYLWQQERGFTSAASRIGRFAIIALPIMLVFGGAGFWYYDNVVITVEEGAQYEPPVEVSVQVSLSSQTIRQGETLEIEVEIEYISSETPIFGIPVVIISEIEGYSVKEWVLTKEGEIITPPSLLHPSVSLYSISTGDRFTLHITWNTTDHQGFLVAAGQYTVKAAIAQSTGGPGLKLPKTDQEDITINIEE